MVDEKSNAQRNAQTISLYSYTTPQILQQALLRRRPRGQASAGETKLGEKLTEKEKQQGDRSLKIFAVKLKIVSECYCITE